MTDVTAAKPWISSARHADQNGPKMRDLLAEASQRRHGMRGTTATRRRESDEEVRGEGDLAGAGRDAELALEPALPVRRLP